MSVVRSFMAGVALAVGSIGFSPVAEAHGPWGGLYIGAHLGHAWTDLDWKLDHPFATPQVATTRFDLDDVILGGQIGIQHQFGNMVLGVEGTFSSGTGSSTVGGVDLFAPGVGTLRTEIDWLMTATARVGYAWDRWLGYVKGGYAGGMVRLEADDNVPPDGGFESRKWHHGWTVGAGVEHMLTSNVVLGFEYNYIDLGQDVTSPVVVLATGAPVGPDAYSSVDTSIHSVTARLSFKLNRPEPVYAEPLK